MADAHTNFAYSTVATAPSPASSGTSLVVAAGDGAKFPAVPFNATVWPVSTQPITTNAEIVRVTNIATDTLTITRAQESSSARVIVVGDQIAATITAKSLTDIENAIPTTFDPSSATHAAASKTPPVDADEIPLADSAASFALKKLTWANLKAAVKAYTDTLYPAGSGTSTGTNTGDQTSVSGNAGTATKLATARNIDGQSFDGSADITVIAPGTHAATGKTTPADADEFPIVDSAASNILKKLTGTNLKAYLKTYFDTLYPGGSGTSTGTNTGDQTITLSGDVSGSGTGAIATAIGSSKVTSAMIVDGTIVNADVSGTAAIAYSKLNLASSIVTGDIVDGTVANADLANMTAKTVKMRHTNSTGAPEDTTMANLWTDLSGQAGASVAMNSQKFTGLPAGSTAGDSLRYEQVIGTNVLAVANLVAGLAGQVLQGTGPTYAFPPGYELNYTQITSPANITDTSESTATALISPGAITFDGTAVIVEVFAVVQLDTGATGDTCTFSLFEGSTQITRMGSMRSTITTSNNIKTFYSRYRFTPSAASHTYKFTGFVSSTTGTPQLLAGAAGTNGHPPAFIRFTKV